MTTSATTEHPAADHRAGTLTPTILSRIFALDRFTVSASAATLTFGAIPVARLLDWPTWIVLVIGLGFVPYGWLLHTIVRNRSYHSATARATAVGDALWVMASVAVIVMAADVTSDIGQWIIAAQALLVADIGLVKLIGWSRS